MEQLYTFTVFTENRVGLLNQISIIFTRRSVNIESLSVSPSSIPGIHKIHHHRQLRHRHGAENRDAD